MRWLALTLLIVLACLGGGACTQEMPPFPTQDARRIDAGAPTDASAGMDGQPAPDGDLVDAGDAGDGGDGGTGDGGLDANPDGGGDGGG